MKELGSHRDWYRWFSLKAEIDQAYKGEEFYWSQKVRVQWLREGDNNSKFFHACTTQKRKTNRLVQLEKELGGWCEDDEKIVGEISTYYSDLFSSEDGGGWEEKENGINVTITDFMNSHLVKPVADSEIKGHSFQCIL